MPKSAGAILIKTDPPNNVLYAKKTYILNFDL
jgi:hypothetical protein